MRDEQADQDHRPERARRCECTAHCRPAGGRRQIGDGDDAAALRVCSDLHRIRNASIQCGRCGHSFGRSVHRGTATKQGSYERQQAHERRAPAGGWRWSGSHNETLRKGRAQRCGRPIERVFARRLQPGPQCASHDAGLAYTAEPQVAQPHVPAGCNVVTQARASLPRSARTLLATVSRRAHVHR
jgi:hypothetical protein